MTLYEAYLNGLKQLKNPDREEINLRILLCENNGIKSMSEFYLRKEENIRDLDRFNQDLQRFLNGEPVQYIVKKAQFYGDDFEVNEHVLIPRNETEEVVDFAIKKIKAKFGDKFIEVADVCTGSGCIGCELFLHANIKNVLFSDISREALDVAKRNATKLGVQGKFVCSDALDYLEKHVDVVISNPPYILNREEVDESVLKYEPHVALFVDDNLSIYKKIVEKSSKLCVPLIIFEIGYDLKEKLTNLFNEIAPNYKISFYKDINNKDRICSLEKND